MSEDQALSLVMASGSMILVAASLFARRLPAGRFVRLMLAWVAIFAVGYGIAQMIRTS